MESSARVIANCKIVGKIGAGGMGSVYRAVHTTLGRKIALKVLPSEFTRSPEYVARFMREARAIANLNHPNIVAVHDAGEAEGLYYIAMELIEGASLGGIVRDYGPLPESVMLDCLAQAAKGLGGAHKHGLIHRDIKPENMLVNQEGTLKLVDFGLVLESSSQSHLTRTGTFLGTPTFMSPEQCDGDVADVRSDLYSLGATFYAVMTGQPPFTAPTALGVLYKHKFEAVPDPRTLVANLHEETCRIVLKLMAKKREDRYQTADELFKDVEKAKKIVPEPPSEFDFLKVIEASIPAAKDLDPSEMTPGPTPMTQRTQVPQTATGGSVYSTQGGQGVSTPGTYGDAMTPTLISPPSGPSASGSTPGTARATTGFEPTMIHGPGGTHTPRPGPLPGGYTPATPTGPGGPSAKSSFLWIGVAAAALLVVVAGGGFWAYRNSRLNEYVNEANQKMADGRFGEALKTVSNALGDFRDDSSLLKLKDDIRGRWTEEVQGKIDKKEFSDAYAMAKDALQRFSGDESLLKLEQDALKGIETQTQDQVRTLIDAKRYKEAKNLAYQAQRDFAASKLLSELYQHTDGELTRATESGFLVVQEKLDEALEIYKKKEKSDADWQNLISILTQTDSLEQKRLSTKEAAALLSKVKFEKAMLEMEAAAKKQDFEGARDFAERAGQEDYQAAAAHIARWKARIDIERLRTTAKTLAEGRNFETASENLRQAASLALGNDDELRQILLKESARARADGYLDQAAKFKEKGELESALSQIALASSMIPDDEGLKTQLQQAREAVFKGKDYVRLVSDGDSRMRDGKYQDAELYYTEALQKQPDDVPATQKLAAARSRSKMVGAAKQEENKEWEAALKEFQGAQALAKDSNQAELIKELETKIANLGMKLKELADLEKQGLDAETQEDYAKSIEIFKGLSQEHPAKRGEFDAKLGLLNNLLQYKNAIISGDSYLEARKASEARTSYAEALKHRSDEVAQAAVAFRNVLAEVQEHAVRGEKALQELKAFSAVEELERADRKYGEALKKLEESKQKVPAVGQKIREYLDTHLKKSRETNKLETQVKQEETGKNWAGAIKTYESLIELNALGKAGYEPLLANAKVQRQLQIEFEKNQAAFKELMTAARTAYGQGDNGLDTALEKATAARTVFAKDQTNGPPFVQEADGLISQVQSAIHQRKIRLAKAEIWPTVTSAVNNGNYDQAKSAADSAVRKVGANPGELATLALALGNMSKAKQDVDRAKQTIESARTLLRKSIARNYEPELQGTVNAVQGNLAQANQEILASRFVEADRLAQATSNGAKDTARRGLDEVRKKINSKGNELKSTTAQPHHSREIGEVSVDGGMNASDQKIKEIHKQGDQFLQVAREMEGLVSQLR
ncbi:MAG: hypothetical protein AMXMBFR7_02770 [Planctomycetota bacterium]